MRKKSALMGLCLATIAATGMTAVAPATASVGEAVTIYVDAEAPALGARGALGRNGLSRGAAVSSVAEAQEIARARGGRDVTVRLAPGTYAPIDWSYAPKGGHITITSESGGPAAEDASSASVINCELDGIAEYGVKLTSADAGVTIAGLTIESCRNGGIKASGTLDVWVENNLIRYIGSKHVDGTGNEGFGGVHLLNSGRAHIEGNRFYYLENTGSPAGVHGVYAANNSDGMIVRDNNFGYISGDPIRVRNGTDAGLVDHNRFWKTGYIAVLSDWRFGSEICSQGNVFADNVVGNTTYANLRFNIDPTPNGVVPSVRKWGHDAVKPENLGGCSPAPIEFGGGNSYTSTRPW
ncbi:right-handed parallel beta-helix repeat-containing protein [Streptomyces sp. NPDC006527]|uniref:right-handed parallel beta-helix repeat-containing protein n=1 Tax=Streptomyces sp. NPDC006527 TaxID=3364749 RepID=UPI0036902EF1